MILNYTSTWQRETFVAGFFILWKPFMKACGYIFVTICVTSNLKLFSCVRPFIGSFTACRNTDIIIPCQGNSNTVVDSRHTSWKVLCENPLHVGMELYKGQKQGRDESTCRKMVEKRDTKSTLQLFHYTIKFVEQMQATLLVSLHHHLSVLG